MHLSSLLPSGREATNWVIAMSSLCQMDETGRKLNPDETDNLAPAHGILASALTALGIWLVIIGMLLLLLSRPAGSMFTQLAFDVH